MGGVSRIQVSEVKALLEMENADVEEFDKIMRIENVMYPKIVEQTNKKHQQSKG